MKFSIERDILAQALSTVSLAALSTAPTPILSHVKMSANGRIEIASHALDRSAVAFCSGQIDATGAALLPLAPLQSIINGSAKGGTVDIAAENRAAIKIGRSRYMLPILDADEFPAPLTPNEAARIEINGKELGRLIVSTLDAAADPDDLYHLGGVFFHLDDNRNLVAVAADNKRLHIARTNVFDIEGELPSRGGTGRPGIIIPAKAAHDIRSFVGDADVELRCAGNVVEVARDDAVFASKLIDASFPDYEKFVPEMPPDAVRINREELLAACQRITAIGSKERGAIVTLQWNDDAFSLAMSGGMDGGADGIEQLAFEAAGKAQTGINARQLAEAASAVMGEFVVLRVAPSQNAPIFLLDPSDPKFTAIIMPCAVLNSEQN